MKTSIRFALNPMPKTGNNFAVMDICNYIITSVRKCFTYTVALCIRVKAHRTSRFGVAPERALGIHTLKAKPAVMAHLHTLVDV